MPTPHRAAAAAAISAALCLCPQVCAFVPHIRSSSRYAATLRLAQPELPEPLDHVEAYPDLEFVNYDVDENGNEVSSWDEDELYPRLGADAATDKEVEEMREARRVLNDVFQFQTYNQKFLEGREWRGEWTVYRASTFLKGYENVVDENGAPRLMKDAPIRVVSTGTKVVTDSSLPDYAGEHIVHSEIYAKNPGADENDVDTGFGRNAVTQDEDNEGVPARFWPAELDVYGFRGPQGNMFVGPAYTLCDADLAEPRDIPAGRVPNAKLGEAHAGPFSGLRTEVGISDGDVRMRLKLEYRAVPDLKKSFAPLRLAEMTLCREADGRWPGADPCFRGRPGAGGGLFDPPPLGGEEQGSKYMMLDLEGFATCQFPHTIDQDPEANDGRGWVATLDWSPGAMRYQADRKFMGGTGLKGLRSLELTEIQSKEAEQYKPQKGPQDLFKA